jgi:glycosyltransferase involved in cell wall biosynthesis
MVSLSICIPIFNHDCTDLILRLDEQCALSGVPYEIVLLDDGSTLYKEKNRNLTGLEKVNYVELPQNIGRAAIRNRLTETAQFSHLLFMDCDTQIIDNRFIENYLSAAKKNDADVILGGVCYSDEKPPQPYLLRWIYGKNREERPAHERNQQPYRAFTAFNALIRKEVFEKVRFDESLKTYGHEDTLIGWQMKKENFVMTHIDNPARKIGLATNDIYLKRNAEAVENLWKIYQKIEEKNLFREDVKILKYFHILERMHIENIFYNTIRIFNNLIFKNLKSDNPNLHLLDLYKLATLCQVSLK